MKRFKTLSLIVAVLAVLIAAVGTPVSAQSSASLSIVPKKNYTIEPGKSINDTLIIRNLDNERNLDLTLRVVDFTFIDDGGAPKLMLAEDAPQTTWSMKPFLTIPKSVSVPPKESRTLDMSVAIPENHGAGSYYSAIVYSSGSPDGGNVGLSASGVTLVFTSVPGAVDETLTLEKFGAYNAVGSGGSYTFLTTQMPQRMAYTLKNEGNVTQSPVGSITLQHMFGGEEIVISDINPNESLALIGQARTFVSCIKLQSEEVDFNGARSREKTCSTPKLWPGRYSAKLHIFYGQNGNRTQEISGSASFWYLPWWFLVIFFAVLAVIAYIVWRIVRKVRGGRSRGMKSPRRR